MEWFSLAELAGSPIIGGLIQVIRNKVRKSIEQNIKIEPGLNMIAREFAWTPIVMGLKIISKTPAKLKIIGVEYIVYHSDIPIQSGYWEFPSKQSSIGYPTAITFIDSKGEGQFQIAVNLVLVKDLPFDNEQWKIIGDLYIDCGYGKISKPIECTFPEVINKVNWETFMSEFNSRWRRN